MSHFGTLPRNKQGRAVLTENLPFLHIQRLDKVCLFVEMLPEVPQCFPV